METEVDSVLPDSGDRTAFNTGAVRDAMKGKGIPSMIPTEAIYAIARRFEDGATKYGADNWRKGIPYLDIVTQHTDTLWLVVTEMIQRIISEQ